MNLLQSGQIHDAKLCSAAPYVLAPGVNTNILLSSAGGKVYSGKRVRCAQVAPPPHNQGARVTPRLRLSQATASVRSSRLAAFDETTFAPGTDTSTGWAKDFLSLARRRLHPFLARATQACDMPSFSLRKLDEGPSRGLQAFSSARFPFSLSMRELGGSGAISRWESASAFASAPHGGSPHEQVNESTTFRRCGP